MPSRVSQNSLFFCVLSVLIASCLHFVLAKTSRTVIRPTSPELTVDTPSLGDVYTPEVGLFTVSIHNNSTHTIKIENVLPSCHCTRVLRYPKSIQSGGHVSLPVSFDSKGRKGVQNVSLIVLAEGYAQPQPLTGVVTVKERIPSEVELTPASINARSATTVLLQLQSRVDLSLFDHLVFDPTLLIASCKVSKAGVQLALAPKNVSTPGEFSTDLFVCFKDSKRTKDKIEVKGTITPLLSILPDPVSIGIFHSGDDVQKEVHVVSVDNKPFRIVSYSSDPEITIRYDHNLVSVDHKIEIVCKTQAKTEALDDSFVINTDNPLQPHLSGHVIGLGQK